ncbi:MAG TPA: inositol monophosphatase [Bryobacteraceae bacterium]|jgi:histidinol phosphatase-like enzyme (inositol monophosphatase family)|nr:inositol monophosphatase [Bryobacteraceae bacterium]
MAFEPEIRIARLAAEQAGSLALDYQRKGVAAETKADESPVTAADRACEKLIVEVISREFPDDGFLGEEGASRPGRNGRKWIIDPIDGTKDFVRGIPLWAVLIGLEQDGEIIAAAAYSPGQSLLLHAAKGMGAFANDRPVRVSNQTDLSKSVLSFNGFNKVGIRPFADRIIPWVQQFWAVRCLGGAVDAMLLAQGQADIWVEPNAQPWDLAPLKLLVEEAGGKFADFTGHNTIYGGNAYACTPALESHVRELLNGAPLYSKS